MLFAPQRVASIYAAMNCSALLSVAVLPRTFPSKSMMNEWSLEALKERVTFQLS